jgi:hypothetical protein
MSNAINYQPSKKYFPITKQPTETLVNVKKIALASSVGLYLAIFTSFATANLLPVSIENQEETNTSNDGIEYSAESKDDISITDSLDGDNKVEASIKNNTITDNAITSKGIRLEVLADTAFNYSEANLEHEVSDIALIDNNTATNNAVIRNDLTAAGIELKAVSNISFGANADGDGNNLLIDDNVISEAKVANNTITNSGSIFADGGISVHALATLPYDDVDNISLGTDGSIKTLALIDNNKIFNYSSIVSEGNGIELFAEAKEISSDLEGLGGTYEASITNNLISSSGRIISREVGILIDTETEVGSVSDNDNLVRFNTINNSGLIVSDPGLEITDKGYNKGEVNDGLGIAVQIGGDSNPDDVNYFNSLNISAPAYLAGQILLNTDAKVNLKLTSGPSHSVRWSIANDDNDSQAYRELSYQNLLFKKSSAELLGVVPWFVNEESNSYDVYATIDPSAFAAAPNMLGDLSGMVSSMAKVGLEKNDLGRGIWLSVQGGKRDYKGDNTATIDQETTHAGIAIGYAHRLSEDWRVSGSIGANQGRLEVGSFYSDVYANSYKNKANGGFLGLHFAGSLGPVKMNIGISGGANSHKDRRFVNDNLQWWGIDYADAKYDSTWFSPEIGFAIPFKWDSGWSFTPSISWRYSGQHIDGYSEKNSTANATVASRTLGVNEANLRFDVTRAYGSGSSISGMLGYLYRGSVGDNNVQVEMIGDTRNVPFFYKDLSAGVAGLNWKLNIKNDISVYLNANYIKGSNVEGGDVATGLKVDF